MGDDNRLGLDDLLKSPAVAAPRLPPEAVQALNFIRVEQVLAALLEKACGAHCQALEVVKRNLAAGGVPEVLEKATARLGETRDRLVAAVNELSAFSTDPAGWLVQARASGRVAALRQFGVV